MRLTSARAARRRTHRRVRTLLVRRAHHGRQRRRPGALRPVRSQRSCGEAAPLSDILTGRRGCGGQRRRPSPRQTGRVRIHPTIGVWDDGPRPGVTNRCLDQPFSRRIELSEPARRRLLIRRFRVRRPLTRGAHHVALPPFGGPRLMTTWPWVPDRDVIRWPKGFSWPDREQPTPRPSRCSSMLLSG